MFPPQVLRGSPRFVPTGFMHDAEQQPLITLKRMKFPAGIWRNGRMKLHLLLLTVREGHYDKLHEQFVRKT